MDVADASSILVVVSTSQSPAGPLVPSTSYPMKTYPLRIVFMITLLLIFLGRYQSPKQKGVR
jgi:hypothetical protein